MVIFNSYVSHYQRVYVGPYVFVTGHFPKWGHAFPAENSRFASPTCE
jgi:calcineurin-like phosphoesterase family protein